MKKYFSVTYKHSDWVYCSNIAHAENIADVESYYNSKYSRVYVRECYPGELEEAKEKGKPIVEIEERSGNNDS